MKARIRTSASPHKRCTPALQGGGAKATTRRSLPTPSGVNLCGYVHPDCLHHGQGCFQRRVAVLRLARVIPEREAWLYENPNALASVRRGLEQARKGMVAKTPPDLKAESANRSSNV